MKILSQFLSSISENTLTPTSVVGVDMGSSSIKVVQLDLKKDVVTLGTYGELQLGPYAEKPLGQSVSLETKQEQAALVDVIRESAVTARNAVFAMPLSSSFVTNISLEADKDADLSSMVRVEARKVIPISLSEVTLDWAEVEVTKEEEKKSDKNKRNVLIAAIQNSALDRFKILMQFAGLKNPPTEIECFSSIRGLYSKEDNNVVVVDIGANSSKLYLSKNGLLMRMHRIRAGGMIATKRIADVFEIGFDDAEIKKQAITRSDSDFGEVQRAHHSSYERGFREFKQVIQEYEQKTGFEIKSIYLSGGGSLFPGTDTLLSEAMGRDVIISNPFSKVAYPAFMEDTMKEIGPSFTVALGAALRKFE